MRVDEGSDHCQKQASHLAELSGANATQIFFSWRILRHNETIFVIGNG